jgi:hypothetical protein
MDQKERIFGIAADAVYIDKLGPRSFRTVSLTKNTVIGNDIDQSDVVLSDKILEILRKTSWGVSSMQTLGTGRVLVQVVEEFPQFRVWYLDPLAEESILIEGFNSLDLVILE